MKKLLKNGIKKQKEGKSTIQSLSIQPDASPRTAETFSIEALISQGINKGISVETMERLLAMRRELKAEWAKEQYDRAMANFQANCPTIKKTKGVKTDAGIVAYQYAPLESIVEQIKNLLQKNGFSYSIQTETKENLVKAICTAKHIQGHSESSSIELPLGSKTKIMSQTQLVAAALTFAKRYAFCNAFGILTGDEDNDAGGNNEKTEDKFTRACFLIKNITDKKKIAEAMNNIEKSTLYTETQKSQLMDILIARQDELS